MLIWVNLCSPNWGLFSWCGESQWHSFKALYSSVIPDQDPPPWMVHEYDVWFRDPQQVLRNQLSNHDFDQQFDYVPKQVFAEDDKRIWSDFMSGNWAWQQAVCLSPSYDFWMTAWACNIRTKFQRTLQLMAHYLCLSFLAATRQLSPLQQVKMTTTQSTYLLGIFITLFIVYITTL